MRLSKGFVWFLTLLGLAVLGYGLYFTRFSFRQVLSLTVSELWPLGLFLGLGAVLIVWSIGQARRPGTSKSRAWIVHALFGFMFLSLAVLSIGLFWRSLLSRFGGDQTDESRLAQLAHARLDPSLLEDKTTDWPQWRGPRRDGRSAETGLNSNWEQTPPATLWRRKIGGGYSSISIAFGRLYTMDRQGGLERIVCLDADTGNEVWSVSYPVDFGFSYNAGPRATPTIALGRLYSVGSTGVLLCLELPGDPAGRPRELWRHDLLAEFNAPLPQWGIACSPVVEDGLVIVQPGGSRGSVAAYDWTSGKLVWSSLSDPNGYSSPMAADLAGRRQVVVFTGEGVAGLDLRDGKKLWYFHWPEQFQGNIATPIIAGNFVFISSAYNNGGCALLEITGDGNAFEANVVYVKKGKLMQNHHATCILHEGCLYGFDKDRFKCVDLRTATEKWVSREPGKGCLTYADGHLIILTEVGRLAIAEARPDQCKLKGKIDLFDRAETWAVPVLSRGRLYVRDKEEILCLDLRPKAKQ